jgi:hypothetical protein
MCHPFATLRAGSKCNAEILRCTQDDKLYGCHPECNEGSQ